MDMRFGCPTAHIDTPQGRWVYGIADPSVMLSIALPLFVLVLLSVPRWRARMQQPLFLTWFGFLYQGYAVQPDDKDQQSQYQRQGLPGWRLSLRQAVVMARSWLVSIWDVAIH